MKWCPVLTGGMFECDIIDLWHRRSVALSICSIVDLWHRRSLAVLCMMYKIRCNPMHPLNGAIPGPYVPVLVTRGALVAHRYTYGLLRCRTSQYRLTFIRLSLSLRNDLVDPVFDVVEMGGGGIQEQGKLFFIRLCCSIPTIVFYYFYISLLSVCGLVLYGCCLRTDRVYFTFSQPCTADLF